MKRKYLKILLPIILVTCIISFILNQYPVKSFSSFIGNDETKITRIFIFSGSSGKTVYSNDKAKIKGLIELLKHRYYIKSFDQRGIVEFTYKVSIYNSYLPA